MVDKGPKRNSAAALAVGIVVVEFAAAVSRFVASTLLPVIAPDLEARGQLALLLAGSSLGLFVAIPLTGPALRKWGARGTLGVGVAGYLVGLIVSATALVGWVFAVGQFISGSAGGLLALFGFSAAIKHLDDSTRARVIAISASMWILPALIGPVATLGMEHLIGWRWALLVPVPAVLLGRLLIVRAVKDDDLGPTSKRPIGRMLLIPIGAAGVMFGAEHLVISMFGVAVSAVGLLAVMPRGTMRLNRGVPSALIAMLLFGLGYFGADSLITILLTDGFGVSLGKAAIVLSAAPIAWGLTSLIQAGLGFGGSSPLLPQIGLALAGISVLTLAIGLEYWPSYSLAIVAWALSGVGVGLAYPPLYVLASKPQADGVGPSELAVAVVTAEDFGGLMGRAVGGAISSFGGDSGLTVAYALFAASLIGAVAVTGRTKTAS
ncbi:MFS transporter [Brevibacterium spongiae]|uniref:MFS transporter n=1 Tax=Brevibacterium spongiae TaxID=2909672 RepID=A0ABY5SS38_9MICO|nr:MFS transporter [Brevibacterium spongiae]UVI36950.1 MFS transporter [Brevibacterium spongiae]